MSSATTTSTTATATANVYPTHPTTLPATIDQFNKDVKDTHLIYDYDITNPDGSTEKWRYEFWFYSATRMAYAIHGGPMAGRVNFQTVGYQCIRAGELWQANWLEETGTVCSLVYDIKEQKLTTLIAFSKGHWDIPELAHGDKRNVEDFKRWHHLARQGTGIDRVLLQEQALILENFKGAGDLEPFDDTMDTIFPPKHTHHD